MTAGEVLDAILAAGGDLLAVRSCEPAILRLPPDEAERLRQALVGVLPPEDMAALRPVLRPGQEPPPEDPPTTVAALIRQVIQHAELLYGWRPGGPPVPWDAMDASLPDLQALEPRERERCARVLSGLTARRAADILSDARNSVPAERAVTAPRPMTAEELVLRYGPAAAQRIAALLRTAPASGLQSRPEFWWARGRRA